MTCQHCGHSRVSRPRKLCWACYYEPRVRDLYAPAHRGLHVVRFRAELAPTPTTAPPGSPEKFRVLQERCLAGVELHHPGDFPNGDGD